MNWGKKVYILVALVMSLAFVPSAMAFNFTISNDKLPVSLGDTQALDIIINSDIDDFFIFSVDGITAWTTLPTNVPVLAGQPAKASVYFSPYSITKPAMYNMVLILESVKTKVKSARNFSVIVRTSNVAIEQVAVDGILKPDSRGKLKVYFKNYENKPVTAEFLYTIVSPDGSTFLSGREPIIFGLREFKTFEKELVFPECFKSGEYKVFAELKEGNVLLFSLLEKFNIEGEFKVYFDKRENHEFLRTETAITVKNIGNIPGTTTVSEKIWGSLFFSGDLPKSVGNEYVWEVSLDACESKAVKYSIDYTLIPVVIVIGFALFYVFFRLRTVRFRKYIIQKQLIQKGMQFTVGIEFKSHSNVKDVEIRDFIPAVFKVIDSGKATKHESHAGTELVWKVHELKSGEERIFSYKIIPLFSVTGSVKLPRTSMSFNYLGKRIEKKTFPIYIGLDLEDLEGDGFSLKHITKHFRKQIHGRHKK